MTENEVLTDSGIEGTISQLVMDECEDDKDIFRIVMFSLGGVMLMAVLAAIVAVVHLTS